jgi:hypothetical protein
MSTKAAKRPSITWAREVMANRSRDVQDSFARFIKDYKIAPVDEIADRLVFFAQTLEGLTRCPGWAREKAWACVRDYVRQTPCQHECGLSCPRCGERSAQHLQVSLIIERHAAIQHVISPMMMRVQLVGCEHYQHAVTCATCGLRWPGTALVNVVAGLAPERDEQTPHEPATTDDPSKPPN